MSLRKLLDSVEILVELRKNKRALWDVTFPKYSNVDICMYRYLRTHIYITYVGTYLCIYVCTYVRRYVRSKYICTYIVVTKVRRYISTYVGTY